jgi:hypothetical protein
MYYIAFLDVFYGLNSNKFANQSFGGNCCLRLHSRKLEILKIEKEDSSSISEHINEISQHTVFLKFRENNY